MFISEVSVSSAATVTRSRAATDVCLELSKRRASVICLKISEEESALATELRDAPTAAGADGADNAFVEVSSLD